MIKLITTAAAAILLTATAASAVDERTFNQDAEKNAEIMTACQGHVKDGKMTDGIPSDLIGKCREVMLKNSETGTIEPRAQQ